jgi:hypothetical protein
MSKLIALKFKRQTLQVKKRRVSVVQSWPLGLGGAKQKSQGMQIT